MEVFPMAVASLLDHFSALGDPRQSWKVVYPLPEILLVVLCGTLAGAQNIVEIRQWAGHKLAFLRGFLPFARGVPSHDTLCDVLNALDAATFSACFTAWVASLADTAPEIVAIDGKTSRRAHGVDAHPLHVVSAWASRQRLVLGQQATAIKSNEIIAIPLLLERLELTGALVTIDAMGCQRGIATAIRAKGADYLLALKDNQPSLADEVRLFFDQPPTGDDDPPVHTTTDADHGRIETRHHRVSHDVAWLTTSRRFPGEPRFPDLAAIAMVEAVVEHRGKTTTARRYFLCSTALDAKALAAAVRAHWGIENRLHWVMDVVFHDDLMRMRTEHGPANMATVRHMALNLLRSVPGKQSLAVKRKSAGWDEEFMRRAVTQIYY
jgi:predicted transposase YbfD/YdcC